jgi:hypothetical protein
VTPPVSVQNEPPAAEQPGDLVRGAAERSGDRELRQHRGDRDADLGVRGVQLRLGGAHIGPLFDDLGRQAQRQLRRQLQRIELEGLGYVLVRQVADQGAQQIARLLELRLQRGQQGLACARAASCAATSMRIAKPSRN